ncbi:nickel/cobalt transporter, partial [Alphaproteobacteria bacterium]|nr:nickel/cobalt transporter [Alphaproteobacteria bacterium]
MTGKKMTGKVTYAVILYLILLGVGLWALPLSTLWSEYLIVVQSLQRDLQQSLSEAMRRVELDGFRASLMLIALSFGYGVFHAVGPGHGKIIITTYLLSHESQLRRGVILAFASSLVQGATAIIIVSLAVWILDLSMRQTSGITSDVEIASFALIVVVGGMIALARAVRLAKSFAGKTVPDSHHYHKHAHKHSHKHSHTHSHGPSPDDLQSPLSLRTFAGIVMSIGIRPCSGAVIVLLLAYSLGLHMAGLFSVLAMSLGTALTVSVLAGISVYLREVAKRLIVVLPDGNAGMQRVSDIVGLIGGLVIFAFGAVLLSSAL